MTMKVTDILRFPLQGGSTLIVRFLADDRFVATSHEVEFYAEPGPLAEDVRQRLDAAIPVTFDGPLMGAKFDALSVDIIRALGEAHDRGEALEEERRVAQQLEMNARIARRPLAETTSDFIGADHRVGKWD